MSQRRVPGEENKICKGLMVGEISVCPGNWKVASKAVTERQG